MKTYRIEVVPEQKATPYHLYERKEPITFFCFTIFMPKFTYHSSYERINEAEEYAVRGENQKFQGYFYQNKRIDINQAKILAGEIAETSQFDSQKFIPRIDRVD